MNTNIQLKKNKDNSFTLELTLDKSLLKKEYQHVLGHLQAEFEQKGFRKGKAPLDVVEKNISPQAVLEEVLNHILPAAYQKAITDHHLHPIVEPAIKVKNEKLSLDTDWNLEITSTELPPVKILPSLFTDSKKINQDKKIEEKDKINHLVDLIIKNTQVDLPEVLITHDLNHRLSGLVSELQKANLTLDQYLKNKQTDMPKLREEITDQIKKDWTLNLGINQIAQDKKLTVDNKELEAVLDKNPELKKDPNLVYFLLTQQKVLEFLKQA